MKTLKQIALACLLLAGPALAESVVVQGGRVIPIEGEELEDGAILIEDGRITAVGPRASVRVPYDATVIDAKGQVVLPAWVLAHTSAGVDVPNENLPVTPFLDVGDAIDPSSVFFEDALRDGTATVHVLPGHATVIGGVGRVVQVMGLTPAEMTLRAPSAIKLSVGGALSGWDRVRHRARLREAFAELEDYLDGLAEKRWEEEEKAQGRAVTVPVEKARELGRPLLRPEDVDDAHRALWRLRRGELDAFVHCDAARDVDYALSMALELGFLERTVLVLGGEAWKAVDVIKAAGRPVVLAADLVHREADPATGREVETFVPRVFDRAGVPFALLVDPDATFAERYLSWQAARCVREGVDRPTALRAITLVPAQVCGVGDRLGSIVKGKDGTLVLLSGDPLSARSHVDRVLLRGRLVYERARDHRLRRLVTGREPVAEQAAEEQAPGSESPKPEAPTPDAPTPDAPKPESPTPETPRPDGPRPDSPPPGTPPRREPMTPGGE